MDTLTEKSEPKKIDNILNNSVNSVTVEEKFLKPFELGWKREVVMRSVTGSNKCDIYYLHPSGKKLRSMTEVKANLTDNLTLDCFTFKKEPLNVASEIIRKALDRGQGSKKTKSLEKIVKNKTKSPVKQKGLKGKKVEKPNFVRPGIRKQRLMSKKEQKRNILEIKNLLQSKNAPKEKKIKNTSEKVSKEISKIKKNVMDQNKKSVNKRRLDQGLKYNGKQLKGSEPGTAPQKLKLDNKRKNHKYESNDIRSIVKRNIKKYRELRKKQLKAKLREGDKKNMPYKMVRQTRRSEPLSKNMDIYLKPFEKGWKRELVHRVNGPDAAGKSDVYYLHPNGKKLRSTREIADNLTQGLTIDCFTFRKEALGVGEPQEVIRNARLNKTQFTCNKK